MSFWLDKLAAVPRIATSAPRARERISAVAPANITSTSPEMSVWTNRGLPVISRTSADKSYGENSTFFGHPWKRQRNARAYVGDTQLISGYGTAARKNANDCSDRP